MDLGAIASGLPDLPSDPSVIEDETEWTAFA
jgi:hypothetical protein